MLKLNKLLFYTADQRVFSDEVAPTDAQRKQLAGAKNDIRDHLRAGIAGASATVLQMPRRVDPKFRTQGSWSYNTCIQRFLMPPQEMDWDFGVYLPVELWEAGGPPHTMARAYFTLVETLLSELCKAKGWKLVPGKDTCIRVQIANWAHIDVPLYAAPAVQFVRIRERALTKSAATATLHDADRLLESIDLGEYPEQAWEELHDIVLACRSGQWIKSDPETVSRWFNDKVLLHTEQLRRVCRYAKAWRDKWWTSGGPSSVCLMIAIAQGFKPKAARDDLALEHAMRTLAQALKAPIREAAIGPEDFNSLEPAERAAAAQRALETADALQQARMRREDAKAAAIQDLRRELGDRIPDRTDLIDVETVAAQVLAVAPTKVVPPIVRATSAG